MRTGRILLIVFLLLVLVTICVVMGLQLFRVREVVVEGCSQRDPLLVAELAQVDYDESIFKLRLSQIRDNINQSPYFEVEEIGYILPDKLRIQVHERAERAVIQFAGSLIIMDEEGYILEVRQSLGDSTVPVVTGLEVSSFQVGEQVESEDPKQLSALQVILTALLDQEATHLISEIDVAEVSDLCMITTNGFLVELGNFENMDEKIRWLRGTLPVLISEGYVSGTLNLSTGKNATFQGEGEPLQLDLEEPESSQTQESSDLEEEPGVEEAPQSAPEETQEDAQATQTPQTGDEE